MRDRGILLLQVKSLAWLIPTVRLTPATGVLSCLLDDDRLSHASENLDVFM